MTAVTAGRVVGVAAPSQAAPTKSPTSLSLSRITHVATASNTGPLIIAGDGALLQGTASADLIGQKLTVQIRNGTAWTPFPGSGTVSRSKTYTIRIHPIRPGSTTFRVSYSGSTKLSASKATRSTTVWAWSPLVDLPFTKTIGSASSNAAPGKRTNVVIGGVTYPSVMAGNEDGQQTGATEFNLDGNCRSFTTKVGLADGAPAGTLGYFTLILDAGAKIRASAPSGAPQPLNADVSHVSVLTIENSDALEPGTLGRPSVTTAWPGAEVLCDVAF